jgi:Winged helix DNA-binding domain
VRARPRGSWTSSQFRWATVESWLPEPFAEWPLEDAQTELVRRWLAAYGPGTERDLRWWTGWPARDVRRALAHAFAREVAVDGAAGFVLGDDEAATPPPEPWVALLPALDPTVMGWAERSWYLGEHTRLLFDRSGNAGPTVWAEGRVVGGWAQRRNGEVAFRLLEDVGCEATSAVGAAAARLERLLHPTRVTPRFRTPLERQLAA